MFRTAWVGGPVSSYTDEKARAVALTGPRPFLEGSGVRLRTPSDADGLTAGLTVAHTDNQDPRWRDWLSTAAPGLFQHPDWASLMEEVYGFPARVALAIRNGLVVGGLPYSEISDFRGKRRVAGAFADVCEPLGEDVWPMLEQAMCEDGVPWSIRARVQPGSPASSQREIGLNLVAELPAGPESAMRFCEARQPKQFRHAVRAGVTCRLITDSAAVDVFYDLHTRLRVGKFRLLPQPRAFFEALVRRYFPDRGLLLAAELDGRIIAAEILLI